MPVEEGTESTYAAVIADTGFQDEGEFSWVIKCERACDNCMEKYMATFDLALDERGCNARLN